MRERKRERDELVFDATLGLMGKLTGEGGKGREGA